MAAASRKYADGGNMRRRKVLVTGFPPFGGGNDNISQNLIKSLSSLGSSVVQIPTTPRVDEQGAPVSLLENDRVLIEWQTELLSCDEAGSNWTAERIASLDCDAILHLGLCNECEIPRLERVAKNLLEMRIEDNSGRKCSNLSIVEGGSESLNSTSPMNRLAIEELATDVGFSDDAGGFVCNETYYRTLDAIQSNGVLDRYGRQLPCLFLHLPDSDSISFEMQSELVKQIAGWLVVRPRIVVACSVLEGADGRFISCRRAQGESFAGAWEFPGGKVERGETLEEAFIREIDEELSLPIDVIRPLAIHVHEMAELEIELHAWHCRIVSGQPRLSVHDELRWLKVEEFMDAEWIDADIPLISRIQSILSS